MARDLISLIRLCGYAGVSGQSFVNNVLPLGAKSGTKFSDYFLDGWTNWTTDYAGGTLANNSTIHFEFDAIAGTMWQYIRAALSAIDILIGDGTDPGTFGSISLTGVYDYGAVLNHVRLSVTVRGRNDTFPVTAMGIHKEWNDYGTEPNPNPLPTPQDIRINGSPTYGTTSAPVTSALITLTFPSDAQSFNPGGFTHQFNVTVTGTTGAPNITYEWYTDSGYTTLYDTGDTILVTSPDPDTGATTGTLYMRYKIGTGAWTNFGAVNWSDPRAVGHF